MTWTEDRATQECDPSADPGAKTEGRAASTHGAARPSLRDWHQSAKLSRHDAANAEAGCPSPIANTDQPTFQFTLNQDTGMDEKPKTLGIHEASRAMPRSAFWIVMPALWLLGPLNLVIGCRAYAALFFGGPDWTFYTMIAVDVAVAALAIMWTVRTWQLIGRIDAAQRAMLKAELRKTTIKNETPPAD
jgi:hypothetical protein